jgi:hypothetical protein
MWLLLRKLYQALVLPVVFCTLNLIPVHLNVLKTLVGVTIYNPIGISTMIMGKNMIQGHLHRNFRNVFSGKIISVFSACFQEIQ